MSGLSTPASADPPPAPGAVPGAGPMPGPGPVPGPGAWSGSQDPSRPYSPWDLYGETGPWRAPAAAAAPASKRASRLRTSDPERRAGATPRVVLASLLTGLLTAWLLYDGLGANLLICGVVTAVGAGFAARVAGRRIRPWTAAWSLLALALLAVPAVWSAPLPTLLAAGCALALASLAVHGGRRWTGVLLAMPGFLWQSVPAVRWAWISMEGRSLRGRDRIVPVLKALAVAAALLTVFGLLFASADAAMADLLSGLSPDLDLDQLPGRGMLFVLGTLTVLGFAHIAAGPRRWDRTEVRPGRERRRTEWMLPLVALNLLFGVFAVIQAVVVLGGADAVLSNTGMSRSAYARQGFWQLSVITVLTLVVVTFAKRWAPRTTAADRRVAKVLLGMLCVLALAVVASALGRMWFYVDASGLTRARLWVLVVEIWLGVVFLLLIASGLTRRAAWLPRVVVLSGMLTVAVYGLMGPDAIVANQNVSRYERALRTDPLTATIDLRNVRTLSADAVPALDRLPEPQRSCSLQLIQLAVRDGKPWYATDLAAARARQILAERPVPADTPMIGRSLCDRAGSPY